MRFLKRLFCQHVYRFERNWGPHLAFMTGGAASTWRCKFCDKLTTRTFYGDKNMNIGDAAIRKDADESGHIPTPVSMNILNLLQNLDPNTMIDVRHGINECAVDSFTVGDLLKAITPNVSGMPVQPINFAPENESYGGTD